ncbi:HAMP domain-containing protein [Bacterioplanoides sp.]|uniref:HAMP domain-containing protein n=1 Tax=Bacterioplanoides sp. TaxID=2066072 RepID=UPI003B5B6CC0
MVSKIRNSIVFRIGSLLMAMTVMAVLSMFSSFVISEIADKDAAAINVSGSLRKQSYLMLSTLLVAENTAAVTEQQAVFEQFETILSDPVLISGDLVSPDSALAQSYKTVVVSWKTEVKPALEQYNSTATAKAQLFDTVNSFVDKIDFLVLQYQQAAESKIELLRIIQIIALFSTLILVYVAMTSIHGHIEKPLAQLTAMARRVRDGDLTSRVELDNKDELGLLAQAFNSMSDSLSEMYADLEGRVSRKTMQLKRSNDSLQLLLNTSRLSNNATEEDLDFQPILDELSNLTGIGDMDLCITKQDADSPYIHLLEIDEVSNRPNCDTGNCEGCLSHSGTIMSNVQGCYTVRFALEREEHNYGVLVVRMKYKNGLEAWQHQLIQAVADQIAVGLSLKNQVHQDRRVALLNERTVIARELHDSLAQSLSYLKIQVSRMQKAHDKQADGEVFQNLIDEIRDGLGSAYRQLRELLSTFRLQVGGRGLKGALEDAISQLSNRTNMKITLDYQVDSILFTPNEEIHLLQIAKEALQNSLHHSKGENVKVSLVENNNQVTVSVADDGVGIPDGPEKMNHYGLDIMKERAKLLTGRITMERAGERGTIVTFVFSPESIHSNVALSR